MNLLPPFIEGGKPVKLAWNKQMSKFLLIFFRTFFLLSESFLFVSKPSRIFFWWQRNKDFYLDSNNVFTTFCKITELFFYGFSQRVRANFMWKKKFLIISAQITKNWHFLDDLSESLCPTGLDLTSSHNQSRLRMNNFQVFSDIIFQHFLIDFLFFLILITNLNSHSTRTSKTCCQFPRMPIKSQQTGIGN